MSNFEDFYSDLLAWEGQPQQRLVDSWTQALRIAVEQEIVSAVPLARLSGAFCRIQPNSSNQSVGNQVEAFIVTALEPHLVDFDLMPCRGAGYPDKMLIQKSTNLAIPLEMKATADWNPQDSNRRVLTSSTEKLRSYFVNPMCCFGKHA